MEPITFLTQAANHVPACAPFQIDIADIPGIWILPVWLLRSAPPPHMYKLCKIYFTTQNQDIFWNWEMRAAIYPIHIRLGKLSSLGEHPSNPLFFATSSVVACWPPWSHCRDTGERKHHKSTLCGPASWTLILVTRSVAHVIYPQKGGCVEEAI